MMLDRKLFKINDFKIAEGIDGAKIIVKIQRPWIKILKNS
jgi:hypothetical protein